MKVVRAQSFLDDYEKLSKELQKRVVKQLQLFAENPRHPALGVKKIKGTSTIFEGRVSRSCRFTFQFLAGVLVLRRIGEHDKTLKNP